MSSKRALWTASVAQLRGEAESGFEPQVDKFEKKLSNSTSENSKNAHILTTSQTHDSLEV